VDGSDFFNRSWAEFKAGFNDSRGNYWLGNELLSQLTSSGRYKLRFDLQETDGNRSWYWAEYSRFTVLNEASNYALHVAGYSSNTGSFDAFGYSNRMMFTTYDRDNDAPNTNCAVLEGGGFWHKDCSWCNVNTIHFSSYDGRRHIHLATTRMWLMCQ